jgi:hypothetical protein
MALLLLGACTSAPPEIDTGARSHDGLYPVRNTGSAQVWTRADLDLSGYDALLPEPGGVRYVPTSRRDGARGPQPLDADARARLEALAADAFRAAVDEVAGFERARAPGPEVLLVRATLVDVLSRVPPETGDARRVYIEDLGEATLVVELVDSESRAVLLRAVETRQVRAREGLRRSTPARNWSEVERLLDAWALELNAALERLHARFTIAVDDV